MMTLSMEDLGTDTLTLSGWALSYVVKMMLIRCNYDVTTF